MTVYSITLSKIIEQEPFTFSLDLDCSDSHQQIMHTYYDRGECYEPDTTALILRACKPGDFVIDVGANIGLFTIMMAKLVGAEGKVLAFEPNQENYDALLRNIDLNEIDNVEAIRAPLWSTPSKLPFYKSEDSGGGHALWDPGLYAGNELTRQVKHEPEDMLATTLEQEIARVGRRCTFIKVDVEGADQKVLEGMGHHRPDFIVAESNPFGAKQFGCDNASFRKLMQTYGYDCFIMSADDRLPAMLPDNTMLTNGFNGFCYENLLFSTLHNVGRAYPEAPNISIPVEDIA